MIKKCKYCHKQYNAERKKQQFCSKSCAYKSRTTKVWRTCLGCGKSYLTKVSRNKYYCSIICTRKKSITTCKHCGKEFIANPKRVKYFCGRKCMGLSHVGIKRDASIGLKISRAKLKNGIPSSGRRLRKLASFRKVRQVVLSRDNWICQMCGSVATDVHHIEMIKKMPNLYNKPSNCVSLCKDCHDKKVSKNEESWRQYFKNLILKRIDH